MPNSKNEVFALVLKNVEEKKSNKELSDLTISISNNYPDVKFYLLKVKLLKTFKKYIYNIFKEIYVDSIIDTENIAENDLVAIATSSSKFNAVS